MNILDTNGINHVWTKNLILNEEYYLVPDVVEESDLAQMVHGRRLPNKINQLSRGGYFDQAIYLKHYKVALNKYGGRSFYNMTGFGDISTIAALHMLLDVFEQRSNGRLFSASESVVVFTNDNGLTKKIESEFVGKDITVKPITDIS